MKKQKNFELNHCRNIYTEQKCFNLSFLQLNSIGCTYNSSADRLNSGLCCLCSRSNVLRHDKVTVACDQTNKTGDQGDPSRLLISSSNLGLRQVSLKSRENSSPGHELVSHEHGSHREGAGKHCRRHSHLLRSMPITKIRNSNPNRSNNTKDQNHRWFLELHR